jgi:CubicO group peptidase (beta-lactamase class C family)
LKRCLASAALGVVSCARICAQDPNTDAEVDELVQSEMKRQHIPGLALGVYSEGKITKTKGYGVANVEWGMPVQPDTVFQSGSVEKQFVATDVMMLVEDGKVGLDDSVRKHFRDAPETWNNITVRNRTAPSAAPRGRWSDTYCQVAGHR